MMPTSWQRIDSLIVGQPMRYLVMEPGRHTLNHYVLLVGKVNASRLPANHRLDISFSRQGRFFDLADSEFQIQVINAYSRRNVWFYQYDFDKNPVKQTTVPLLPILPAFSYTLTF
jgi:hypothetical protein